MGHKEEALYLSRLEDEKKEISEAISKVRKKHSRKISSIRKKIYDAGCEHHFYTIHTERDDDGYGKWFTRKIKVCSVCLKRDQYTEWPIKRKEPSSENL